MPSLFSQYVQRGRLLAALAVFATSVTAVPVSATAQTVPSLNPADCYNGTFVVDPGNNPGLVADCTALVAVRNHFMSNPANAGIKWEVPLDRTGTGRPLDPANGRVRYLSFGPKLTGTIPPELGNLTNLEVLRLNIHKLTGPIPPELGNLTNLKELYLVTNKLTGTIPPELGNLTNLEVLRLSDNRLTGPIPPQLGNLTNLESLSLYDNQLTGPIPPQLGNLTNLKGLTLSDNQLTGPIPPQLGNLTNLESLRLDNNQLTGPIPPELGNLTNLKGLGLYLSDNQLTGPIPPQLGNLTNLELLKLDDNQLTGPIPPELGNLRSVHYCPNLLTGAVPPAHVYHWQRGWDPYDIAPSCSIGVKSTSSDDEGSVHEDTSKQTPPDPETSPDSQTTPDPETSPDSQTPPDPETSPDSQTPPDSETPPDPETSPDSQTTPRPEISGLSSRSVLAPRSDNNKIEEIPFQVSPASARIEVSESIPNLRAQVDGSGRSRTLKITIEKDTRPGSHPVTVTATNESSTTSETINITVTRPTVLPPPKFSIKRGDSGFSGFPFVHILIAQIWRDAARKATANSRVPEISGPSDVRIEANVCGDTIEDYMLQVSPTSATVDASSRDLGVLVNGSGGSRTLEVTIKDYNRPGSHPVTVTATNGSASTSETINVTVTRPPKFKIEPERGGFPFIWTKRLRIYALRDFTTIDGQQVSAGDKGGIVKVKESLSQSGCSWIADGAVVEDEGARVRVSDNALITGNAKLNGKAEVSDNAIVKDDAKVYGKAKVQGTAMIGGNIEVAGGVYNDDAEYRRLAVRIYYELYEDVETGYKNCGVPGRRLTEEKVREYTKTTLDPEGSRSSIDKAYAGFTQLTCNHIDFIKRLVDKFAPSPWELAISWSFHFKTFEALLKLAKLPKYIHTIASGMHDVLSLYKTAESFIEVQEQMEADQRTGKFKGGRELTEAEKHILDQLDKVPKYFPDVYRDCILPDDEPDDVSEDDCLKISSSWQSR